MATLNHAIATTGWLTCITIGGGNSALLQQTHELPHGVCDGNLRLTLDKNIKLGILVRPGLLARGIKAALGGDGGSGSLQNFGDIRAIGDGPTSFLWCKGGWSVNGSTR